MSLMKTLAKVAIGVAVAKGAKSVLSGSRGGRGSTGEGGLFGGAHSPNAENKSGLEDIMSDVLSGGRGAKESASGGMGGLGGLLESLQQENPNTQSGGINDLLRGRAGGGSGGGLGSLIEQMTGGQAGGSGGLGGLLGGLVSAASGQGGGGDFGSILNQSMGRRDEPEVQPSPDQEAVAGLMLKAMIQAAKSDGKFDEAEQAKLMEHLGDVSPQERDFVNAEMRAPVDAAGLARQVPQGLERQVYAMSLLGIDLDNQNEAQYLHTLAQEFGMDKEAVNLVHAKMGAPSIYG